MIKHETAYPKFSPLKKDAERRFNKEDRDKYAVASKSCHFTYGNSRKKRSYL